MMRALHANGMKSWLGVHPSHYSVPANGRRGVEKKKHAQWRWGSKKALRRARRRFSKVLIEVDLLGG